MKHSAFGLLLICLSATLGLVSCAPYTPDQAALTVPAPTNEEFVEQPMLFADMEPNLHYNGDHITINAPVKFPDKPSGNIPSLFIQYGDGRCNEQKAVTMLLPDFTEQYVIDYKPEEQNGRTVQATLVNKKDSTGDGLLSYIMSYPGRFCYMAQWPDSIFTSYSESPLGTLDGSLLAAHCQISADEAQKRANELVEALQLPFTFTTASIRAISPNAQSRINCGYYIVNYPQTIMGIPVAQRNKLATTVSFDNHDMISLLYGISLTIADFGFMDIDSYWLNEETVEIIDPKPRLLTLNSAIEIIDGYLNPEGIIEFREVRFEYYASQENEKVILTPCWTFDTLQGEIDGLFSGIRVSAITGEILCYEV